MSSPEEQRVIELAERLTSTGQLTYGYPRDDATPIPTCVGCDRSGWGEIRHSSDCDVQALVEAVRALHRSE